MTHKIRRKYFGANIAIAAASVAFGAVFGEVRQARAVLLAPGDVGPAAVSPTPLGVLPAGDTLVPGATETENFVGTDGGGNTVFKGSITSEVFADPSEPLTGNPGLDFLYMLTNTPDGFARDDAIDRLSLSVFTGYLTDADYLVGTGNVAPTTADRNATGKTVGFNFPVLSPTQDFEVYPGQTTTWLVVETNALNYAQGSGSAIDGGAGTTGVDDPTFGILISVPEPASVGLVALVGGMLLGRRRR